MQKKTPQDYANELLKMYRENANVLDQLEKSIPTDPEPSQPNTPSFADGMGGIQVVVTTVDQLYPVKNALVTIFTGQPANAVVIATDTTDQNGKSSVFYLNAPPVADSQQSKTDGSLPYANYNISVQNDGYVEQIAMNVPVFSGVVSVQGINLLPLTTAGKNQQAQIINEGNNYNL